MAHTHSVIDADKHFVIDPVTRAIANQSEKLVLMQGDHNSECFTFELPKTVDGHDMTLCNSVQVHYINVSSDKAETTKGLYAVSDLNAEDEKVTFSWLVSGNATKYAGKLSFIVKFKCLADDGTIDYVWNTAIFEGISISNGINNTDEIAEEYADILAEWEKRIIALEENGTAGTDGLSAYEVAVENGFEGTEEQWLESLKGMDGCTPQKGVDYWNEQDKAEIKTYVDNAILGGEW